MKHILLTSLLGLSALTAAAQSNTIWFDEPTSLRVANAGGEDILKSTTKRTNPSMRAKALKMPTPNGNAARCRWATVASAAT